MADPVRMHVNGTARIKIGLQGATAQGSYLGMSSQDGVSLRIVKNHEDVYTDASGPVPADVQQFPDIGILSFTLISYADDILADLFSTNVTAVATWNPGETLPPGILLGANGGFKSIRIDAPYGELPYVFPFAHLFQEKAVNLGTKRKGWTISLRVLPGIGSNSDPGGFESDADLTKLYYRPTS